MPEGLLIHRTVEGLIDIQPDEAKDVPRDRFVSQECLGSLEIQVPLRVY